jgi:hypothetical protein
VEEDMITGYVIVGLAGLIIGGVSAIVATKEKPEPVVQQVEQVATQQQEIIKQLTDTDLLLEPCSIEYIEKYDNLLCREMFCRMMTRGVDAKTSGNECEEISNVANSYSIIEHCALYGKDKEECHEKYRERK